MDEIWKAVPGYEDYYEVSNLGRVKSLARTVPHPVVGTKRVPERIMEGGKINDHSKGGGKVNLWMEGVPKTFTIAAPVLLAFVGDPPTGKAYACFKRYDSPPSVDNVFWGSSLDLVANKQERERTSAGPRPSTRRIDWAAVLALKGTASQEEIAKKLGYTRSAVRYVLTRQ